MRLPSRCRARSLGCAVLAVLVAACGDAKDEGEAGGSTSEDETAQSEGSTGGGSGSEGESEGGSTGAVADSSGSDSGTSGIEFACEDESECLLHSDCCSCVALHVDEPVAACNMSCDRTTCESWGVSELLCSHTCHILLIECDPTMVTCDEAPPACDDGFVPSLDERCWSGYCIPEALCQP